MGGHSPDEIRAETRTYVMIFAALAVLTVVTVAVSYLDLPAGPAVALGMFIATVKASLVALYFMHLIDERKVIYAVLALTAAFFAVLMLVPAGTIADGTGDSTEVAVESSEAAEH